MAASEDFLQTSEGDLDVSTGDLRATPDLKTFVAQGLSQNLNFWEGEWFLDLRLGIPFFRRIIGTKYEATRPLLTALLRKACALTAGVGSVDAVGMSYDSRARAVLAQPVVHTVTGELVEPPPFIIDSEGT